MIFIEGVIFSKYIHEYMDDAEYAAFQWYLALNPEARDVIPRSGDLEKFVGQEKAMASVVVLG